MSPLRGFQACAPSLGASVAASAIAGRIADGRPEHIAVLGGHGVDVDLEPVADDESLVHDYLLQLLVYADDTSMFDGFVSIAERFPDLLAAMLPIGAYDPPWFMEYHHMNPAQAGEAERYPQHQHVFAGRTQWHQDGQKTCLAYTPPR